MENKGVACGIGYSSACYGGICYRRSQSTGKAKEEYCGSATGTTKGAAKRIKTATGGKMLAIKAAEPYTEADLDYGDDESRVTKEHESADSPAESSVRPKIKNLSAIKKAVKKADVVYIGYPIWSMVFYCVYSAYS